MNQLRHPIFSFLGCLCLCSGVGLVAVEGSNQGIATWYLILDKPSWAPPMWLFAPVMSFFFGIMGVAFWSLRRSESSEKRSGTIGFSMQLGLSGLWPWLFFAGHWLLASTVEIIVLWSAAFLAILLVLRASKAAAILLVPYLFWITFIGALNFSIWKLNPHGAGVQVVSMVGQKIHIRLKTGLSCLADPCLRWNAQESDGPWL